MRVSDGSSDVCSSDLSRAPLLALGPPDHLRARPARADHLELRAAPAPPSRPLRRGSVRGAGGAGVTALGRPLVIIPTYQEAGNVVRVLELVKEAADVHVLVVDDGSPDGTADRSEEHTSELQSLMRISYAVFCLKKQKKHNKT